MFATGGVLAVGGVVWAILNRPQRTPPRLEVDANGDGARAMLGWQF
jgi:hypothetical protein